MLVQVLQAKIRNAIVTGSDPEYKGSITIDEDILDELGVSPWQVCDVNQKGESLWGGPGFRGQTYILAGPRGTGCVECNGALAYHISKGDTVHVNVYCLVSREAAESHDPIIIESNKSFIK